MKFKLDENFGTRTQLIFQAQGHDAHTVREESLCGSSDKTIYDTCLSEQRCLVTLDLDFTNVIRFPPSPSCGIAVIRFARNPSLDMLSDLVNSLLNALQRFPIQGKLWVVEPGRIRIHDTRDQDA